MKDEGFVLVLGWMVNRLKLSGNELMCYALIYGFSQDGQSEFKGSQSYIAESLNVSRENTRKILQRLEEKGLIKKRDESISGVKFCRYSADLNVIQNLQGVMKHYTPCNETSHNNIIDSIDSVEDKSSTPPLPPKGKREVKKVDYDYVDLRFKDVFLEWLEYKKDRKESYKSERAVKLCYDKLIKLSGNNPYVARQIVEQSMANNWAGLFELKQDNKYGKRNYEIERDSEQRKHNSAIAVSTRVQEAAARRLAELKAAGVIE